MDQLKKKNICISNSIIVEYREINSPGLQSVNNEQIDKRTFDIVKAGDQLSFKISKQITP